jgi:HEAT repeat protein
MKPTGLFLLGVFVIAMAGAAQTEQEQAAVIKSAQATPESPKTISNTHASEVMSWSGWGKFTAPPAAIFGVPLAMDDAIKSPIPGTAYPIRIKFLVHAHIDSYRDVSGRVTRIRHDLEGPQVAEVRKAIARLPYAYAAVTKGQIRVIPDVEVFEEVAYPGANNQTPSLADLRVRGRTNDGSYTAEDGVFRGPYFAVLNVAGGSSLGEGSDLIPFYSDTTFDYQLVEAVNRAVSDRWKGPGDGALSEVLAFGDTSTATHLSQLTARAGASPFSVSASAPFTSLADHSANVELSIVGDSNGQTVLRYREQDLGRHGGASLPRPVGNFAAISFQARSTAKEPVAIRVNGRNICLGASRTPIEAVPFKYDGSWQTVTIPVDAEGAAVADFAVVAPPDAAQIGRAILGPVDMDFRRFETSMGGSVDMIPPANAAEMGRATSSDTNDGERLNLIKSNDREVQLAAILNIPATTNKGLIDQLLVLTNSIDAQIATAATRKYAALVAPEVARPELVRILKFGLTDRVRGVAALALAQSRDPKASGDILVLLANRTVQTRLDAAEALGKLPGKEAGIIRMAFVQQSDPAIKLAVTTASDPTDEYQMRKLLWSAVNEPSDEVRLQSALRLIQSPVPAFRADGYKVVRDDSYDVRLRFVRALGADPKEVHRDALRLAVVDSSPQVRAAAVVALTKLPQSISPDEVESLFRDEDPRVQEQMIRVVDQKKWPVTPAWIALLKKSPIEAIKAAGDRLGMPISVGE